MITSILAATVCLFTAGIAMNRTMKMKKMQRKAVPIYRSKGPADR